MARQPRPWFRVNRGWFVTVNGKQVNLNVSDPNGEEAAIAAFKALLAKMRQGSASESLTVTEAVAKFLERAARQVKPSTLAYYHRYLGELKKEFGSRLVADLKPEEVEDAKAIQKLSPRGRRNYLQTADSCIRSAGRKDWRTKKPTKRRQPEMTTPEVYWQLRGASRGDFRAYLDVLWHTGARPSEIAGLTVQSVDWDHCLAKLSDHKTDATGKPRIIHFSAPAMDVLKGQRTKYQTGPLFRNEAGKPLCAYQAGRRLWRICERRSLKATLYGFRHSFITRALANGVPEAHVAELVGHENTTTLFKFYSHLGTQGRILKASLDKIA